MRPRPGHLLSVVAALIVGSIVARGQAPASSHLKTGLSLLRSGDLRHAEIEFRKSLELNPRSATAYVLLGITENGLNKCNDAIRAFHSALELDPSSAAAHYNLAQSLTRLRRDRQAIRELEAVVHLNPRFEPALYNLGLLLEQNGRYQESIRFLEDARAQRRDDPALAFHLVEAYFRIRERKRALLAAQQGINGDTTGDLSARLGALLVEQGDYHEAAHALEKARTYVPQSAPLAVDLAKAYIGCGQPGRAIELLGQFANGPLSWQIYELLGVAYQAAGRPLPAIKALQQAILLKPDSGRAHFDLGTLLLGRPEKSTQQAGVEELRQAINLEPRNASYYEALGQWLLEKHSLSAAMELLQRGIERAPPTAELYLMLAVAKIELQGSPGARPLIAKALALYPHDGPALHLLGKCYYLTGNYSQAGKYFEAATRVSPDDGFFFYDAAIALERANRVREAIPYAETSVRLDPGEANYHYVLGKLYMQTGRRTESIRELEACVRLNPHIVSPYYLLATTYRQMGNVREATLWSRKLQKLQQANDKE